VPCEDQDLGANQDDSSKDNPRDGDHFATWSTPATPLLLFRLSFPYYYFLFLEFLRNIGRGQELGGKQRGKAVGTE
jgi:hypothetical protein